MIRYGVRSCLGSKSSDEHLLNALREQIAAQKELIAALRDSAARHSVGSFPCGCQSPIQCVNRGGGGLLAYGVHCRLQQSQIAQ